MLNLQSRSWEGNQWEEHIQNLLKLKYALGEYQEIKSTDGGDLAIEGFSRDGIVYQCYAPEEPLSTKERRIKQQNKITKDIGSFINYEKDLKKIFGALKIKRWLLVVPLYNSRELVAHAEKKATEVLSKGLTYVADDFSIGIIDESYFKDQLNKLYPKNSDKLEIQINDISAETYDKWKTDNDESVSIIKAKLLEHPNIDPDDIWDLCDHVTGQYITGLEIMSYISDNFPDIYERIIRLKRSYESQIKIKSLTNNWKDSEGIGSIIEDYTNKIMNEMTNLSFMTAQDVIFEAIGDWLSRCPLRFKKG